MKNIISRNRRLLLLSLLLSVGCGGGGGGDDQSNIPGVWVGSVSLIENTCPDLAFDLNFLSFVHLVNQSGSAVAIDNGARTYSGQTTSVDGFLVQATEAAGKPGCRDTVSWRYEKISAEQTPFVVRKSVVECPNTLTCLTTWSGSAYRPYSGGGIDDRPIPLYEGSSAGAPAAVTGSIEDATNQAGKL